jgi:type I restriction enzyme S subunit
MTLLGDGFSNHFTSQERSWREIKSGFTHFQDGDVGLAKITPCLENRKSAVFRGLINGIGAGTTELHIFRPIIQEDILPEYLLWVFKSETFILSCIGAFSGAVGQQRVGKDHIADNLLPIPPKSEQNRIVSAIESVFAVIGEIEKNKADLLSAVITTKSKILSLAIRGKLVPQDPADEPASALLERIGKEREKLIKQGKIKRGKAENAVIRGGDISYYGKLPLGWELTILDDIANVLDSNREPINTTERNKRIKDKSQSELYPYFGATGQVGYIDDYLFDGTYLLLGEDGAPFLDKTANKAYIISGKVWVNNHAHILGVDIDIDFLCHTLNTINYENYVNGTTRLKLTQADMKRIAIPLPPLAEQKRISDTINVAFQQFNAITKKLN